MTNEAIEEAGLGGTFYETGVFNDQPVYSNGVTKFIWFDEETDENGKVYPAGYYQFEEVPTIDLTNAVDLTEQVSGALAEYAPELYEN